MQSFGWARVGVFYAKADAYASSYREALDHAGIRFEALPEINAAEVGHLHILLLCGYSRLNDHQQSVVADWVKKGGCVICSGSLWGLESLLGLEPTERHLSKATIRAAKQDQIWPDAADHARFFGGTHTLASGCEVLAALNTGGVGASRKKAGKGLAYFLAPHVGQTIRLMQTGRSVECDAVGPADGSARLDDGVLRAEDGTALSFEEDRSTTSGCETPFFAHPHADVVREIFIRSIVQAAEHRGVCLPLLWHWPNAARAAAILTIDCEEFERDNVNRLHRMLSMFGMPAAWIVGMPGYSVDVYRAMRAWEHELGCLFQTDDSTGWHSEKMKIQMTSVSRLTAQPNMISARAQDGRWRGWTTFYDLCENAGARVSLSKGGRQPGTSGFLFGTSQPFTPLRRDGTSYLVTEIPYCTYNPGLVTPDPVAEKLLYVSLLRYGCFHMVCSSDAVATPAVSASLRRLLSICKQQRLEFLLPEQVHRFERGRRSVRLMQKTIGDEGTLQLSSDTEIEGLTLLLSGSRLDAELKGREMYVETVERYGATFTAIRLNLEAKQQVEVRVTPQRAKQAA
jgi:hypothetical protein